MKRIINNKVYDTSTAEYIGTYLGDWDDKTKWFREELYKKRTGEYFIYIEGGADSKHGKDGKKSEEIKPLSFEEAKYWGEKHLCETEYEIEFEVDQSDDSVTRLHVEIPTSLNNRLELERSKMGVSKSELVIDALENYLNK